jgi:pyruvate dehydrogenase E2 component (dihydrolipoamide acetyltransferase)
MATEIKLQALKENVDTVEVNAVLVEPGDEVGEGQPLLEVQADKATLEVAAPVAGRIKELRVQQGDAIAVGDVYCVIEAREGAKPAKEKAKPAPAKEKKEEAKEAPAEAEEAKPAARKEVAEPVRGDGREERPARRPARVPEPVGEEVSASPGTRRLAREWGIDLGQVHGSGRGGRILDADLKGYVRQIAAGGARPGPSAAPELPDFSQWGPVEREALNPIRRATARQMALAWAQVPHVTQHDLADITDLEAFRKSRKQGPHLTVTAFALKASAIALQEFPHFNASFDARAQEMVLKRYVHIGVAVDTEAGLLVPVVRDVDRKGIHDLAMELADLADRARRRKLDIEEMQGGTFTITNLGGIGGTAFTPIINHPEVAILGMSRGRHEPRIIADEMVPRMMLPLSLSYDHRVIDGADAARFTRRLAELLEQPLLMLLKA